MKQRYVRNRTQWKDITQGLVLVFITVALVKTVAQPSPNRLKAKTVSVINKPGKAIVRVRRERASGQHGSQLWWGQLKKEASCSRVAVPMRVACTTSGARLAGKI